MFYSCCSCGHVRITRFTTIRAVQHCCGKQNCKNTPKYRPDIISYRVSMLARIENKTHAMPKKLGTGGWAQKPCLFLLPDEASSVCAYCEEGFSFLNRRNHCEFCGYVFHGADCSRKCWVVPGELLRRRICVYCDRYRSAAEKLRQGAVHDGIV